MIEPIHHPVVGELSITQPDYLERRDQALLWRATNLALESAFRFGLDLPVGAVAAEGNFIAGRGYANDKRFGPKYWQLHAEKMAVLDTEFNWLKEPDTVVVTLEPCSECQEFLAGQTSIKRVGFGLSRNEVAEKGLVKPHDEDIFGRAQRLGHPFEPFLVKDEELRAAGSRILDFVSRDVQSGEVSVNTTGLSQAMAELNAA